MAISAAEEVTSISLQKGLSEWWSEETEYVFQRIERWAALARGYNRLRSQRLSRGRMTMHEEHEPRWSISSNRIIVEDPSWSPRFRSVKKATVHRRNSQQERSRINCCGTFNYQSNSHLDNHCLETYRYDHSIYFKTIGEIRNSRKTNPKNVDDDSSCSDERIEWEARFGHLNDNDDDIDNRINNYEDENDNIQNVETRVYTVKEDQTNIWPIVDINKLTISCEDHENSCYNASDRMVDINLNKESDDSENENGHFEDPDKTDKINSCFLEVMNNGHDTSTLKAEDGSKKFLGIRRTRKSSRRIKTNIVHGENNVTWPGVLLNYTKNIDPQSSPHNHAIASN
ncbi:uncharacterized protein LOC107270915 [Cephus cinctus]|uniref:Uncharacterized protein LOC107270915 n=1 Tax=Cephus cinctus TaxID=211228 RepID=A0AAJ7C4U7_CEPCN|nr:uncharacterized protein LOC107270915 [Cephus cinctus]